MAIFKKSKKNSQVNTNQAPPWLIAIIDDDQAVHEITTLALKNLSLEGRKLRFVSAYSAKEGLELFSNTNDIALAFVDVVMEEDDSGLKLIEDIRGKLSNHTTRLILRTGQPGQAPEYEVIRDYDINDYKNKTELSSARLKACVYTALRSYRDIQTIEQSKHSIQRVLEHSASVIKSTTLPQFGSAVLKQILNLLNLDHSALYFVNQHTNLYRETNIKVLAATGDIVRHGLQGEEVEVPEEVEARIQNVIKNKKSYQDKDLFIGYYASGEKNCSILYVKLSKPLNELQTKILTMFASNVALVFENLTHKEDIQQTQKELITVLCDSIELRSKETGGHVRRVALMCEHIAHKLGMDEEFIETIRHAAPLHDIGKISIPDSILHKPGKLDADEWEKMKTHTTQGYELLKSSNKIIAKMGGIIANSHHEHWDGTGYPNGIAGDAIPIEGRIMAIVDVVDALLSKRCYKDPWSPEQVISYIEEQKGKHFDPTIATLLLDSFEEILEIRRQIPDNDE